MLRRSALLLTMALTMSFTAACATRSSTKEVQTVAASAASLKATIPPTAREACAGAELPPGPHPAERDYQVFGARQTARLEICEGKRALAVEALDLHNSYVDRLVTELRPPTFWERIFGKRRLGQ